MTCLLIINYQFSIVNSQLKKPYLCPVKTITMPNKRIYLCLAHKRIG